MGIGKFSTVLPWDKTVGPPGDPSYDRQGWIPPGYTQKMDAVGELDEAQRLPPTGTWGVDLSGNVLTECHGNNYGVWQRGNPTQPTIIDKGMTLFGSDRIITPWWFVDNEKKHSSGAGGLTGSIFQTLNNSRAQSLVITPDAWIDDPTLCTPETYPHCSMQSMQAALPAQLTDYSGQVFNPWDKYQQRVADGYRAFTDPGFEALKLVNEEDLSDYDPCDDPSMFETLFPLVAAIASAVALQKFGTAVALENPQIAAVISVSVPATVFFFSRASIRAYGEDSWDYRMAVRCSLYPLVWYGAQSVANQLQNSEWAYSANLSPNSLQWISFGAGALLLEQLVPSIANALRVANVGRFIFSSFNYAMNAIARFFCLATGGAQEACFAKSGDVLEFPTNRRWDVLSIAGKLTQEVCEREGWERDDPRAEFVFRGLTTGPAMMNAGLTTSHTSSYRQELVDPLGDIYGGDRQQSNAPCNKPNPTLYGFDSVWGWDGGSSSILDVANSNVFACQNWDVLRNALQRNPPPDGEATQVKTNFDKWVGNLQNFGGELVTKADDPNNIFAQYKIPGWRESEAPLGTSWETLMAYTVDAQTFAQRMEYSKQGLQSADLPPAAALWFEANKKAYQYLAAAAETGTTPTMSGFAAFVVALNLPVNCETNDLTLPAFMWAVTALPSNNNLPRQLGDFWNQLIPSELLLALDVCPPAPGLPHGNFGRILEPISAPVSTGPTRNDECPNTIRELQLNGTTVQNVYDVIWEDVFSKSTICSDCSRVELAILYAMALFAECRMTPQKDGDVMMGYGMFLAALHQLGWSQAARAAALLYVINTAFMNPLMKAEVSGFQNDPNVQFFPDYTTNYGAEFYNITGGTYGGGDWDNSIDPSKWCAQWQ